MVFQFQIHLAIFLLKLLSCVSDVSYLGQLKQCLCCIFHTNGRAALIAEADGVHPACAANCKFEAEPINLAQECQSIYEVTLPRTVWTGYDTEWLQFHRYVIE
ncbi:hypothetical protein GCM10023194_78180 [Planotetraspora phitsanulokensis]|uniref:Uncharacterized protein n=1 Tax=Planotetraspora phitsanulokensis TaxID=575192 RepID=A0A8J3XHC8_9ACTN|nr:hypothetical protein Pph01_61070 [Planotetraspora phitsanulokensis]